MCCAFFKNMNKTIKVTVLFGLEKMCIKHPRQERRGESPLKNEYIFNLRIVQ